MTKALYSILLIVAWKIISVTSQATWCGKNYRKGTPKTLPGGQYNEPLATTSPHFLFRCSPAVKPYLYGEDIFGEILVDAQVVYSTISDAIPISEAYEDDTKFLVSVFINGTPVVSGALLGLGSNQRVHFPLFPLFPRPSPYEVYCTARRLYTGSSYAAKSQLFYLPPNPNLGSTVKIDVENGGLMVKKDKNWEYIIPFGFYTSFDHYLAHNLSALDDIAARGFNLVHPVPYFDNLTALEEVLDRMEELNLWLMYDMRWSYKSIEAVTEQVERIKKRKNLLLWYTADEPDGWVDELDAPRIAYDLINKLDGYHPVSLVLNCQDYFFTEYTTGTDIVLHDTYPIGVNATWSTVYDTPCTPVYGDCGCDNCIGQFEDISDRIDLYKRRLFWDGRKGVPVWSVNQAFGDEGFWPRCPSGREFTVQSVLSIIHGATGIIPWLAPTTEDIAFEAANLAKVLPTISGFILSGSLSTVEVSDAPRIQVGKWQYEGRILVLICNLNEFQTEFSLGDENELHGLEMVLSVGGTAHLNGSSIDVLLEATGSLVFILY